jgi:hypothetical protein
MLFPAMHCVDSSENFGAHDIGMHIVSRYALTSDQIIPAHGASGGYSGAAARPESNRFMRQECAFNRLAWRSPSTAITLRCPIMRIITDEEMLWERCAIRLIRETGGDIDIVIDDGSHRIEHQLKSFSLFFPALTEHGVYVVEDTGGVVGDQELVTVNALKDLVDNIMYWPKDFDPVDCPYLADFPIRQNGSTETLLALRSIAGLFLWCGEKIPRTIRTWNQVRLKARWSDFKLPLLMDG